MKMHHQSECVSLDCSASAPRGCVYNLPITWELPQIPRLSAHAQSGHTTGTATVGKRYTLLACNAFNICVYLLFHSDGNFHSHKLALINVFIPNEGVNVVLG